MVHHASRGQRLTTHHLRIVVVEFISHSETRDISIDAQVRAWRDMSVKSGLCREPYNNRKDLDRTQQKANVDITAPR
jgi:hypothetical protein